MKFISATSAVAILATALIIVSATATRVINSDGGFISGNASFLTIVDGKSYNTIAQSTYYNPVNLGWKLTSKFTCQPYEQSDWGSKYGWVGYCLPDDKSFGPDLCGKCLRIQKVGGDYTTARIVDDCKAKSGVGLVLDYDTVFSQIEKTDVGRASGQVSVEYHLVSCYQ